MGFLKKIFGDKEPAAVNSYADFWNWFVQHEKDFYKTVKKQEEVDENFLSKLSPMLEQVNENFYSVTGMTEDDTAELIISTDGMVKDFVFAEEFVAAAPAIKGWKFSALKPPSGTESMAIEMDGQEFNSSNISFYSNEYAEYPDEIDITLVHKDYTEENKDSITSGCLIYLDNLLGEHNTATLLDVVQVEGPVEGREMIAIEKLQGYMLWRGKEFVEKYEGIRHGTEHDNYSTMEAEDENGMPVFAIINHNLMDWDAKASHPWMMLVIIKYNGDPTDGLPEEATDILMNEFEDEVLRQLPNEEGCLNAGRETFNGSRTLYFPCREFRHSSKTMAAVINMYKGRLDITYDIFKDKYWMAMNHLRPQ